MGFFDRLFGKRGEDNPVEESPSRPWEQKPSIYEHIRTHVRPAVAGLAEGGQSLPDEERAFGGSQVRWAAGAMDGVATHHMGGGGDPNEATALLNLVLDYCNAPSVQNKLKVYEQAVRTRTISVIDPFTGQLRQASGVNFNRLYDLAKSFATQATDREPVKLGIAVLGLFGEEADKDIFRILARHDEFTLFCAVALSQTQENPEPELWELAKNVNGWGRIHVVERLADTDNPQIKDWLLREGYKNSVMYEYLAYTCATGGGLLAALERDEIDGELLAAAGEIIEALLRGGPAEDIDSYEDGAAAIKCYLSHLMTKASCLPELVPVAAIRDFLCTEGADWEARAPRGWTTDLRTTLLAQCKDIVGLPFWAELVRGGLESSDERTFRSANQAASILGIDAWPNHWRRLQDKRLDSGRWYYAMQTCGWEHVDEVIALAENTLPLQEIATGPAQEMGLGSQYEPHRCLGFILQGLQGFLGHGTKLVEAGLKSPVVSNRHGALRALAAWGRPNWPEAMPARLREALRREPDDKVREAIQKVMDGVALD
jgi:hypothetical protein